MWSLYRIHQITFMDSIAYASHCTNEMRKRIPSCARPTHLNLRWMYLGGQLNGGCHLMPFTGFICGGTEGTQSLTGNGNNAHLDSTPLRTTCNHNLWSQEKIWWHWHVRLCREKQLSLTQYTQNSKWQRRWDFTLRFRKHTDYPLGHSVLRPFSSWMSLTLAETEISTSTATPAPVTSQAHSNVDAQRAQTVGYE